MQVKLFTSLAHILRGWNKVSSHCGEMCRSMNCSTTFREKKKSQDLPTLVKEEMMEVETEPWPTAKT